MEKSKICVVIPMYGFGEVTKKCIDATIKNAGVGVDIIVVDDGSEIPFKDERVKVIRLDKNVGFTGATNAGIKYSWNDYDYIHLLNNDTEPEKDFIKELLNVLDTEPQIGIACSVPRVEYDGKMVFFNFPIDALQGVALTSEEPLENKFYSTAWLPLVSALIRVEVLHQVGLFDRRMKNHCSDNDFCIRAGIMDYGVACVPKSRLFHDHQKTTTKHGIEPLEDQKVLLSKIRCEYQQRVLKTYPLSGTDKRMYELVFREKV